ncbi:mRNA-decapping enzyme-like protein [Athalia rosae]|uniref:mRNA-decapping enzyme-like protein n=1 Tax=Athalia rosae TaxID=37344 RepID=UPI0020348257|nr:mRNA-decapping enzyme-like protein [Athalia rosae]
MADLTELKMNVAALKRVDPYVKDILETATHVALYTFNAENNEWEKTDVEGALFVYSRNGEPYNSVLIMNRLNTNNLVEPVTQGLDLQLQEPFLLYRNSRCNIFGIWFYDKEECIRIASMLNKLVKESEQSRKSSSKTLSKSKQNSGSNANSVDIFSMLSKAQEDFNTNRGGVKSPGNNSLLENMAGPLSAPLGPDVTSQSVMDFFAKAKVNPGHFADQPPTRNSCPSGPVVPEAKPLLARLMSHPAAHTLEHIEKQQRSTTPQPGPPSHSQPQPPTTVVTNNVSGSSSIRSKKRNRVLTTQMESAVTSASASVSQDLQTSTDANSNDSSTASGFLRIQSPTSTTLNNHHQSGTNSTANPLASLFAQATGPAVSDEPVCSTATTGPALIPPVMFAAPSPPDPLTRPVEPLTRNQLLQAFNYLLRTDPDFVNKLHEAYVESFGCDGQLHTPRLI